jgi:NADPH:quinone reductase-like Zn-dependent oxidoreductase
MQAAILTRYGPPENIRITEVPTPEPKPGEVQVRLHATSVNSGDARIRAVNVPKGMATLMRLALGWQRPRQPILGTEGAGVVTALGEGVSRFAPGNQVIVFTGIRMGCHAEYVTIRETGKIIAKPAALTMPEAACMMFGGLTALDFLRRRARLAAGEQLLVNGAAGSVGCAGVQVGRNLGARVTGVCSAPNADLVTSLGASQVLDYAKGPIKGPEGGYDVILDCVGTLPYADAQPLMAKGGRLIRVYSTLADMLTAPLTGRRAGHRVIAGTSAESPEDMATLVEWAAEGRYRAVLDSTTPFARIADAHARVDSGHKRGSAAVVFDLA